MSVVKEAVAKVLVVGNTESVAVIPETILEGEGAEAFMCRVAVERVCPVAGANGVKVFMDGDVGSDVVEEGVVLVVRAS